MTFIIIRIVACCAILVPSIFCIQKSHSSHKRRWLVSLVAAVAVLTTVSVLFPLEDAFITFSSAESSYYYTNSGEVKLTVAGKQTDLVVAQKGDANVLLMIPKAENGWKIGNGISTKLAFHEISSSATVRIYQYKNSSEYYVEVLKLDGTRAEVTDNYDSKFLSLEEFNSALNRNCYTYYAYVGDLDGAYTVSVDGVAIAVTR